MKGTIRLRLLKFCAQTTLKVRLKIWSLKYRPSSAKIYFLLFIIFRPLKTDIQWLRVAAFYLNGFEVGVKYEKRFDL